MDNTLTVACILVAVVCATIFGAFLDRLAIIPTGGNQQSDNVKFVNFVSFEKPADRLGSGALRYYSDSSGESRRHGMITFNFPQAPLPVLGKMHYWKNGDVSVPALKTQSFPSGAQLVLESTDPAVSACAFAHFNPFELCGIQLTSPVRDIPIADYIQQICLLDGLQVLTIDAGLTSKSLSRIGTLPHLRWLGLLSCRVMDGAESKPSCRAVSGSDVAAMANLDNLRVVDVRELVNPTPMLRRLAKSHRLKRLFLFSMTALSDEDIELIGKLNALETLELGGCGVAHIDRLMDRVAALPNLRSLGLSGSWWTDSMLRRLKSCKHLRYLEFDDFASDEIRKDMGKRIEASLPEGFNKSHLSLHLFGSPVSARFFAPTEEDLVGSGIIDRLKSP